MHGALLDAEILSDVYLAMTGGQVSLLLGAGSGEGGHEAVEEVRRLASDRPPLPVIRATAGELEAHRTRLKEIAGVSGGASVWQKLLEDGATDGS